MRPNFEWEGKVGSISIVRLEITKYVFKKNGTLLILQIIDCVNEKKHERGKLKLYGAIKDVDR